MLVFKFKKNFITYGYLQQKNKTFFIFFLIVNFFISAHLHARKPQTVHTISSGDSIAKIADFYAVSQRDLMELNNIKNASSLKAGQKINIPNVLRVAGKKYIVRKGDTLSSIAKRFGRDVKELTDANKLAENSSLEIGRTLVIPDKNTAGRTMNLTGDIPLTITFLRVRTGERERITLYNKNGTVNNRSLQRLSHLSRDLNGDKVKRLDFRLVAMLQQISMKFPGKPIEIISGYRPDSTGLETQHSFGRAMDIKIPGIAPNRVFQFCKTLQRAGCGLYPKSGFVHVDAREKSTSWISKTE